MRIIHHSPFAIITLCTDLPFAIVFKSQVSVPHYDNGGHVRMLECAGKGICDRKFGMCTCATGFSGRACERAECPNDCSGAGTCLTQEGLAMATSKTYSEPWDAQKNVGCQCDAGYRGVDCSLRECKSGYDPHSDTWANTFGRDCSGRGVCDYSSGNCKCFRGWFGEMCQNQVDIS